MAGNTAIHDIAVEGAKAAPPVAIIGSHYVLGLSLADWAAIGTLLYLVAQVIYLVRKDRRESRACRSKQN